MNADGIAIAEFNFARIGFPTMSRIIAEDVADHLIASSVDHLRNAARRAAILTKDACRDPRSPVRAERAQCSGFDIRYVPSRELNSE